MCLGGGGNSAVTSPVCKVETVYGRELMFLKQRMAICIRLKQSLGKNITCLGSWERKTSWFLCQEEKT